MKHTTFKIDNTSKTNNFRNNTANYSKILDDIIANNIIKKNEYLTNIADDFIAKMMKASDSKPIYTSSTLKDELKFIKAANYLANYNKIKTNKIPFILGKTYKLIDGTPIIFYDDEIQIGFDLYSYDDFKNIYFLNTLPKTTKNIIINIYTAGDTTININI